MHKPCSLLLHDPQSADQPAMTFRKWYKDWYEKCIYS